MGASAEIAPEMAIGASFPYFSRPPVHGILALAMIFTCSLSLVGQVITHGGNKTPRSATASSAFSEAETLLRQGAIAEAKTKIQEQLQLNPSSIEGYNLLGIVYSNEHE